MKKIAFIVTTLLIFFSFTTGVSADSDLKDIEVILSETPAVVNIGDTIALTATTPKHGSSYADSWSGAVKSNTALDLLSETYTSKAIFTAEKPGTYKISYTITMTAGGSENAFSNTVERTVEVIDPRTVVGAKIEVLEITPIYSTTGNVSVYKAYGTIYALWSDNTATPQGSMYFFFSPDETNKSLDVTFSIDGVRYAYTVTATR